MAFCQRNIPYENLIFGLGWDRPLEQWWVVRRFWRIGHVSNADHMTCSYH